MYAYPNRVLLRGFEVSFSSQSSKFRRKRSPTRLCSDCQDGPILNNRSVRLRPPWLSSQLLLFLTAALNPSLAVFHPLRAERWNYAVYRDLISKHPSYWHRQGKKSDVLSFTGAILMSDGRLKNYKKPPILHQLTGTARIYPLIAFANAESGRAMLRSKAAQDHAIEELIMLARQYDGLHLDFEYLDGRDTLFLSKFLKRLYPQIKKIDRTLTLAIFPPNFPERYAGFHDLSQIRAYADGFVLMTYDYHRPSSAPGPVTDLAWAEEAIQLSLKHVPSEKLWLGIPLYGYAFSTSTKHYRTLTRSSFDEFTRCNMVVMHRHSSGTVAARCPEAGRRTAEVAYFPDEVLRQNMEKLASQYHLRGTAYWRLGFEE